MDLSCDSESRIRIEYHLSRVLSFAWLVVYISPYRGAFLKRNKILLNYYTCICNCCNHILKTHQYHWWYSFIIWVLRVDSIKMDKRELEWWKMMKERWQHKWVSNVRDNCIHGDILNEVDPNALQKSLQSRRHNGTIKSSKKFSNIR